MNKFTNLGSKTTTIGQSHKQMCENIWHKKNKTTPEKQSDELKEKLKPTIPDQQICLNH